MKITFAISFLIVGVLTLGLSLNEAAAEIICVSAQKFTLF